MFTQHARFLSAALLILATSSACDAPEVEVADDVIGHELADETPVPHAAPGQPLDLGPIDMEIELAAGEPEEAADLDDFTPRSLADKSDSLIWPKGEVPYLLDASFDPEYKPHAIVLQELYEAMDYIQFRSRIRFRKKTASDTSYVTFKPSGVFGSTECGVGRKAGGATTCVLEIGTDLSRATYIHQLTHVLGFHHEQQRSDRDENLIYSGECVAGTEAVSKHFAIKQGPTMGLPFDPRSIMLTSSYDHCITGGDVPKCICLPLKYRQAPVVPCPSGVCTNTPNGTLITGAKYGWSQGDLDAVHMNYSRPLGTNEVGDYFATAFAVGDFDDDGHPDLAVGAPGEASEPDPASGSVYVYRGTGKGLVPWKHLTQETRPIDAAGAAKNAIGRNDAGDRFGASLAAGDFDDDGVDDLAIGAPGEATTDANAGTGAVFFFRGFNNKSSDARHGLIAWKNITQTYVGNAAEAGDSFGETLAAGDFDHDGRTDLAVGVPNETVGSTGMGVVVVLRQDETGVLADGWTDLKPVVGHSGDKFGAALAVGDLNHDGIDDLVVGAPYGDSAGVDVGSVQIHVGGTNGPQAEAQLVAADAFGAADKGGAFGFAVATGDLDQDGVDDLAVGAPGAGAGLVSLFKGVAGAAPVAWHRAGSPSVAGPVTNDDRYGATLLIRPLLGTANALIVGAPRLPVPGQAPASKVFVFRSLATGVPAYATYMQGSGLFGHAVAVGSFKGDGQMHLVVGLPGEEPGGSANVFWTKNNAISYSEVQNQASATDFRP